MATEKPLLRADGVQKRFGQTLALARANLSVMPGQIHALLGGNGAGKSTLINIISGTLRLDAGHIDLASGANKVAVVHQELAIMPQLTVAENVAAAYLRRGIRYRKALARQEAADALQVLGVSITQLPLDRQADGIALHQLQLMEIARAISAGTRLILLDEPTASLSTTETTRLFEVMRRLASEGYGLVFVSHRMQEIRAIADVVTVMRDGRSVVEGISIEELTDSDILEAMTDNRKLDRDDRGMPNEAFQARSTGNSRANPRVRLVNKSSEFHLEIAAGGILGLAGAPGGPDKLLDSFLGVVSHSPWTIEVDGRELRAKNPRDSIRHGIGYASGNRSAKGILPLMSINENIAFSRRIVDNAWLVKHTERRRAGQLLRQLNIKVPDIDAAPSTLSGGTQQKLLLGRWLNLPLKVLLLEEPTRGVDVHTKQEIYQLIRTMSHHGVTTIWWSTEQAELLNVCDRILTFAVSGRPVNVLLAEETDEDMLVTETGLAS